MTEWQEVLVPGAALEAAQVDHLDGCADCRQILALLAGAEGAAPPEAPDCTTPRIGRFAILEAYGQGAMGVVYRAHDPMLGRLVAIKLVQDAGPDAAIASTVLLREAQAMARLSHSNVVTVYEAGRAGDEIYLAMEWVDGVTVSEWLAACPRSPREIIAVFVEAARGLAAAHAAGVIHRDFKPANVLVGGDGRVRVCDFGLSRAERPRADEGAIAPDASGEPRSAAAGILVGTPAYMAPEQLRGEAADARSDQFSFCVALYESLAGHRPFSGDDVAQLRAAMESGAEPPHPAGAPRRVLRCLRRGLSLRPEDRLPSMAALIEALEPVVGRSRRPARWSAAVASAGLVALAAFLWLPPSSGPVLPAAQPARAALPGAEPPAPTGARPGLSADVAASIRTRYRELRMRRELHLHRAPLPRQALLVRLPVERRARDTFKDTIWVECARADGRLDPRQPCMRFFVTREHDPTDARPARPRIELGPFPLVAAADGAYQP